MERLFKNSRKLLASLGVVAFLMVAGWQFGSAYTIEIADKEEIEAFASSGTPWGGPTHEVTFQSLSLKTINCKDNSGCQ
ncbi:hypothetical protein SAMN04488057_101420 [Cyclobacterium lianum]|uniref:Uncharacterized protein n=1 Tax=Cyclobacterium lianum TaxID=388280 RepID=A0A1M7IPK7_9BACT|nr:hypothetical protein [Cyclobacterium lianum]SHM42752.1 hypothetical protein SAMN04488057_101420 [Cyclobacterium lianum]